MLFTLVQGTIKELEGLKDHQDKEVTETVYKHFLISESKLQSLLDVLLPIILDVLELPCELLKHFHCALIAATSCVIDIILYHDLTMQIIFQMLTEDSMITVAAIHACAYP